MQRYQKDKKVVIYKKISGKDSSGFPVNGYMPVHPQASIWAYFKQLSATLAYQSASTQTKEDCYYRVNWNEYLRKAYPSDLYIYYQGILYQVTRIDPYEDYKRDLALYAQRTTTKLTNVLPYDPSKL